MLECNLMKTLVLWHQFLYRIHWQGKTVYLDDSLGSMSLQVTLVLV